MQAPSKEGRHLAVFLLPWQTPCSSFSSIQHHTGPALPGKAQREGESSDGEDDDGNDDDGDDEDVCAGKPLAHLETCEYPDYSISFLGTFQGISKEYK